MILAIAFLIMFWLGVSEIVAQRKRVEEANQPFNPDKVLGCAGFATEKQLKKAGYFKRGGIRFALFEGRPLFYHGRGHLLLVAAARAGKLLTVLAACIMTLPKSFGLICIDPKLELACILAHFRKSIGPTYVLNPFKRHLDRLKGIVQACLNPMDILDVASSAFHAGCDKLALAFWSADTGMTETHWKVSAGLLISGIIAFLKKYGAADEQNLPAMRDVLTGSRGETLFNFCRRAMKCPDPFIRQKLARFAALGAEENKELASIISTADTQTGFLGNEAVAESLKKSDFRFRDVLRVTAMTVFICLPLEMLDVCDMYFRLMAATMLFDMLEEGSKNGGKRRALLVFDEVAQIGKMKVLSDCLGMGAGAAGLQLLLVYQSISQAMVQFGEQWSNVVQNCAVSLWFSCRDHETRQVVSNLAGVTEVITHSRSVSIDPRTGEPNVNNNASQTTRPLMHPQEVGELSENNRVLAFCEGVNGVVHGHRRSYTKEFRGLYRDNPFYQPDGFLKKVLGG